MNRLAQASEATTTEIVFWQSIQNSDDSEDHKAYLRQFPDGAFAALARNRIDKYDKPPGTTKELPSEAVPAAKSDQETVAISTKAYRGSVAFKDCDVCPDMLVIPPGSFQLGLNKPAIFWAPTKKQITIQNAFAIGKTEVTFDQWEACRSAGNCKQNPGDEGWGRGGRPVINVSWRDAKQYVEWLRRVTGFEYRLPSESEWEYAARSQTTTRYHWGDVVGRGNTNCYGCGVENYQEQTLPVGRFSANAFGLHDMHGNVWEWIDDCWAKTYSGTPRDGTPQIRNDCTAHVWRSGGWDTFPRYVRATIRRYGDTDTRRNNLGFRVARSLRNDEVLRGEFTSQPTTEVEVARPQEGTAGTKTPGLDMNGTWRGQLLIGWRTPLLCGTVTVNVENMKFYEERICMNVFHLKGSIDENGNLIDTYLYTSQRAKIPMSGTIWDSSGTEERYSNSSFGEPQATMKLEKID